MCKEWIQRCGSEDLNFLKILKFWEFQLAHSMPQTFLKILKIRVLIFIL